MPIFSSDFDRYFYHLIVFFLFIFVVNISIHILYSLLSIVVLLQVEIIDAGYF